MRSLRIASALLLAGLVAAPAVAQVDPELPDYKPVPGVSGTIKSEGSDTMNNMMTLWSEGFLKHYPNVKVEIVGKGSSTAFPALITGTANFGPMSRAAKSDEQDKFQEKFGYKATQLATSIDMLAVFAHKDNPIEGLSLAQVDAMYSKTRKLGYDNDVTKWGQLGLTGGFANQPISLYGRNSASGTYGYFKKVAMGDGDYKDSVKEQPGSSGVLQAVGTEKYAIGYSGIGYKTEDVVAVPLSVKGKKYYAPTAENAEDYPLTRFLFVTVNYKPNSELDPLRREFLKYVFSAQGQEDVLKDGYLPLPAEVAKEELAKVGIK